MNRNFKVFILLTLYFYPLFIIAQEISKVDLMSDLDQYSRQIIKKHAHPFNWVSKEAFSIAVNDLKHCPDSLNTDELMVRFTKINYLLKDEHTHIDFHQSNYYPVTFFWFEEGITAVSAFSENEGILGARLIAINDIPIDTVINKLHELTGIFIDTWFKWRAADMLNDPMILHGLKITPTNKEVNYRFVKNNSDTSNLVLKKIDRSQGGLIDLLPGKPLLRNSSRAYYWYKFDDEKKYLYINYNKCSEMAELPFRDFIKSLKETVNQKKPEKVIIDLRYNLGGYSYIIKPLIVYLKYDSLLQNKKIFALIGRRTFSAGVINTYQLQTTNHAKLVGEETGGKLNQPGGVKSFNLKKTKSTVYYSGWDLYLDATVKKGIIPDVETKIYLKDYLHGIDPALDYAIEN